MEPAGIGWEATHRGYVFEVYAWEDASTRQSDFCYNYHGLRTSIAEESAQPPNRFLWSMLAM